MEKTKDSKKIKEKSDVINKIIQFNSLEEAIELEKITGGRKFCKRGQRFKDICLEEIQNYILRNSKNIILKIIGYRRLKKNKQKLLLETKSNNIIRNVIKEILENEKFNDNITDYEIIEKTRKIILDKIKEYKKINKKE